MKKYIIFICLIGVVIILAGLYYSKTKVVYDTMTIPIEDSSSLLNDEVIGFVYFGRDTCSVCLEFNKYLKKEYKANEQMEIYKFDTDYWRDTENFQEILEKYQISEIPMLIRIDSENDFEIFESEVDELSDSLHEFLNY